MKAVRAVLIFVIAMLAAAAVQAEVFKWVDDKGVVNYGNSPPVGGRNKVSTVDPNTVNVSTYSPINPVTSTVFANSDSKLKERVDGLERELESERRARQAAVELALQQKAREADQKKQERDRCLADRRVDCDEPALSPASSAYPIPIVVVRRPPVILPAVPISTPVLRAPRHRNRFRPAHGRSDRAFRSSPT